MTNENPRLKIRPLAHYLDKHLDEDEKEILIEVMKKFLFDQEDYMDAEEDLRDRAILRQELAAGLAVDYDGNPADYDPSAIRIL